MSTTITGHPFDIKEYDVLNEDKEYKTIDIKIWCLDSITSKPFLVTVKNFKPWCYLEVPRDLNEAKTLNILNYIQKKFCTGVNAGSNIHGEIINRNKLFYYQNEKDCFKFIKLYFHNTLSMVFTNGFIENICSIYNKDGSDKTTERCLTIDNEKYILRMWEGNKALFSNIRRLFSIADLKFCDWIEFKYDSFISKENNNIHDIDEYIIILEDDLTKDKIRKEKITSCMKKADVKKSSNPLILSFDIETYSQNHKAFPNPLNKHDKMYMVSCVFQRFLDIKSRERHLIYIEDTLIDEDIFFENEKRFQRNNTFLHSTKNEKEIYDVLNELFKIKNPDVIIGYNTHSFDYDYMEKRGDRLLVESNNNSKFHWPCHFSRNKTVDIDTYNHTFKSTAYGINKTVKPILEGRISIDMMSYVKRTQKLEVYNLNFVSKTFLKNEKDDITAFEMFEFYKNSMDIYKNGDASNDTNYEQSSLNMCKVGSYALQDSELVIDLFEKLNTWQDVVELSSVSGVTIEDTFKGQQKRIFSLIIDVCHKRNIIIDNRAYKNMKKEVEIVEGADDMEKDQSSSSSDDEKTGDEKRIKEKRKTEYMRDLENGIIYFKGAHVGDPIKGKHDNAICVDFASLYPSIMLAYILCFSTLIVKYSPLEDIAFSGKAYKLDKKCFGDNLKNVYNADPSKIMDSRYSFSDSKLELSLESEKAIFDFVDELDENKITESSLRYHFEFAKTVKGILPELISGLLEARKLVKKEMEFYETRYSDTGNLDDKLYSVVLNQRQLAYKVIANSTYGFTSAQKAGILPCVEIAMVITSQGRKLIKQVNQYVIDKYNGKVIYGDSVTGETPIMVRDMFGKVSVIEIQDLTKILSFSFSEEHPGDEEKEKEFIDLSRFNIYIWSEKGFTQIFKLIRHKVSKPIIRVYTKTDGFVDCTTDHSLVEKETYNKLKPTKSIGLDLLTTDYSQDIEYGHRKDFSHIRSFDTQIQAQKFWIDYSKAGYDLEYIQSFGKFLIKFGIFRKEANSSKVVSLMDLNRKSNYVFDVETENHMFAAGVGNLVVHNTDSSMFVIPDYIKTAKECNEWGHRLAKELTSIFPPPLKLEFEKAMRILCLKKKKYAAYLINEDGSYNKDKMLYRGIVLARRDNFSYLREIYKKLLIKILEGKDPKKTLLFVLWGLKNMFMIGNSSNGKSFADNLTEIGKHLSIITTMNENYKQKTFKNFVFGEVCKEQERPIEPGERIRYIIVNESSEIKDKTIKKENLGLKMRTLEMFKHKEENIDYFYYIEHYFQKPIDQMFEIAFPECNDWFQYKPNCSRSKAITVATPVALFTKICKDTDTKFRRSGKPPLTIENYISILEYIYDKCDKK